MTPCDNKQEAPQLRGFFMVARVYWLLTRHCRVGRS